MDFLKPNQSYNASLTADYAAGDATLSVNSIPANTPSIVTVARGTDKETRFTFTGTAAGLLTGVTRLDGANENISAGVSVECMIDVEFITQLESAVFDQAGLKGLVYAADGESTDAYAITLTVAPTAYADIIGLPIAFEANTVNTDAATLNVNGLGAKTIKKNHDQTLADGDIESGQVVVVVYDGTDFQLQSGTPTPIDIDGTLAADSDTLIPSQKAVKTYVDAHGSNTDGWTDDTAHTWVYASASTFTIAGVDLTATFTKGTRIRFKQGAGYKYAVVVGSSFSTNTTVTIAVNDDYTIANAAITNNYYSYQVNPQGYPGWFNYTPTFGGFSASPVVECKYSITGRLFHMQIVRTSGGTSNSTSFSISIPFTAAFATNTALYGNATDNSAALTTPVSGDIANGGTSISVYKDYAGSSWTNSGSKFVNATVITEI